MTITSAERMMTVDNMVLVGVVLRGGASGGCLLGGPRRASSGRGGERGKRVRWAFRLRRMPQRSAECGRHLGSGGLRGSALHRPHGAGGVVSAGPRRRGWNDILGGDPDGQRAAAIIVEADGGETHDREEREHEFAAEKGGGRGETDHSGECSQRKGGAED